MSGQGDAAATAQASAAAAALPVLRLKHREERRLAAGHLWVFSNEIDTTASRLGELAPGSLVRVHSDRDR